MEAIFDVVQVAPMAKSYAKRAAKSALAAARLAERSKVYSYGTLLHVVRVHPLSRGLRPREDDTRAGKALTGQLEQLFALRSGPPAALAPVRPRRSESGGPDRTPNATPWVWLL